MATRKQRRKRAKEQRHDYMWVDGEGNELEDEEIPAAKRDAAPGRQARGGRRQPQAPSWQRTLRRGLIFAPIMLGTVMLLSKSLTLTQQIFQTAIIVAIFIPFSYFLDQLFYRSAQRRLARGEQAGGRRGG